MTCTQERPSFVDTLQADAYTLSLLPVSSGPSPLQEVTLKVAMMCGGCEGAVRRVLTKMPGPTLTDAV